jgi:hypothetical protein
MSNPDVTRRLRGEISAAVRNDRPELEKELRRELSLVNIEKAIARQLDGITLTGLELRRLRLALDFYGLDEARRAAIKEERRQAEQARIQARINQLQAELAAATGATTAEDDVAAVSA